MDAMNLYVDFLNCCTCYQTVYEGIEIKNQENIFRLYKPGKDSSMLYYQSWIDGAREEGYVDNLGMLMEVARYTVGRSMLKETKSTSNSYIKMKSKTESQYGNYE